MGRIKNSRCTFSGYGFLRPEARIFEEDLKLKQMASESLVLFGKQIKRLVDDD
jgi:hypothetical protein